MNAKLENALTNVETTYGELVEIANGMLKPLFDPINQLVNTINTELWDFQLRLGIESYKLANIKEQSSLKEACAEALYKEGLAKSYAEATGAAETKKQASILASIEKQAVSMLYSSISGILKAKLDEAHRLVNIIQNIQISRAAEAKLNGSPRSEADGINFQ